MSRFVGQVSAVSPLGDALDGTPRRQQRRAYQLAAPPPPPVQQQLSPALAAALAAQGVDLLCVQVLGPEEVIVHNRRDWRSCA